MLSSSSDSLSELSSSAFSVDRILIGSSTGKPAECLSVEEDNKSDRARLLTGLNGLSSGFSEPSMKEESFDTRLRTVRSVFERRDSDFR